MSALSEQRKSREKARSDQSRILVIADQPDVPYRAALESAGVEIVGVSGGAAALISLHRHRPHLVIAHSELRSLSVDELVRKLAGIEDGLLPLIVVGSEPATVDRRRAFISSGAFDYFQMMAEVELLALRAVQLIRIRHSVDRLHSEADIDPLTGLANRRRFRVALARELERWRRYGTPCALLLLDIDYMKAINDEHGHPFGDVVIRHVATQLTEVSRDTDTPVRLGGEEFALLLPGIDNEQAELAAQRLLGILSAETIEGVRNVTVSIGLAACPAHANSERTLYAAADAALYVAKNEGRNRVAVAPLLQQVLPGV